VQLLIIVHPGSACGSADFNLGADLGQAARAALADEISGWTGPVLVIDGALSDELELDPLGDVIEAALSRAAAARTVSSRIFACDDETEDWPAVVAKHLQDDRYPDDLHAVVTGAWYFEDGSSGCVNAVCEVMRARGSTAEVAPSALRDPEGCLQPREGVELPPPSRVRR